MEVGGKEVTDNYSLQKAVSAFRPGKSVRVKVLRSGKTHAVEKVIKVELGHRPEQNKLKDKYDTLF